MGSRRAQSVLVVAALAVATMVGAMATPTGTEPTPQAVSTDSATARATPGATPALAYGDLYDAIIPGQRDAVAAATAGTLPRYRIRATLEPPAGDGTLATASGTVEVRYVNTTGEAVDQLPFRLYPNLRQYDAGRMEIERTAVDGVAVSPRSPALHAVPAATPVATPAVDDADLILAWVPLPRPLQPGAATTVSMAFVTTVPADPPAASGRFRYHPDRGAWALSGWYPMLAGYDPAAGWDIDPPAAWSDVTFGGEGLYDVAIAAPESMVLVTPGVEVSAGGDGDARRFVSGPAREFAVYADPSMAETRAEVEGTTVTVHHPADSASGAEQILAWVTGALETYNGLFGAYPYAALDVAAVPGVTGLEFSGMIWLDEGYVADPVGTGSRPGAIEFLVAHEVAHQWWYGVVGSNPQRAPFLDEGLADYSAVLYFEQAHGDDAARAQVDQGLLLPYATMLVTGGDQVVDQPAAAFPNEAAYYATAYRKAALGLEAIRQQIGDDAFHAALRNYAEAHRFGFAAPADLLDAFERSADADPGDLWHLWFETASGRVRIVMEPEGGTPVETPPG
jgi:hypothetical protein